MAGIRTSISAYESTAFRRRTWIFRYKKNPDQKYINDTFAICKKNLKDPQVILRMQTMKGMPTLGPKSREAIDDIVLITKDPVSWEMRKEAIPVLVALTGPDVPGGTPDRVGCHRCATTATRTRRSGRWCGNGAAKGSPCWARACRRNWSAASRILPRRCS